MMTEMKLPACYAVIDENEMTYLDGGATIADSDAYKAFLNVGQVFNQLARIFSGASSIINNINVIYKSVVELNNLLGGFIKKPSPTPRSAALKITSKTRTSASWTVPSQPRCR